MDDDPNHLAQSTHRKFKATAQGNGEPLSLYLPLRLDGKIFQPRRLPAGSQVGTCVFTTAAVARALWAVSLLNNSSEMDRPSAVASTFVKTALAPLTQVLPLQIQTIDRITED